MTAAAGAAAVEAPGQAGAPALEVEGLCKSFRAVRALDQVALTLQYGRVTALLGDNGAGKSTLVKCISGVYAPDAGVVKVDGTVRTIASPETAGRWASRPSTRRWQ